MAGLTPRDQRFVDEYLVDLDPRRAAIDAGYSESVANSKAYQWVSNSKIKPDVYAAIQRGIGERSERTKVTQDMVVAELAKIGFSDLRKVLSGGGGILDPQDWDDETAGAIAALEIVRKPSGEYDDDGKPIMDHVHKIKTWDKRAALVDLGKHLQMFTERVEVTGKDGKDLVPEMNDTEVARRLAFLLQKGTQDG